MVKTVTVPVPDELKKEMDELREVNWAEVGRQAFKERVEDLKFLKQIKAKSKLTQDDALKIGASINKGMAKHFRSKT